MQHVTSGQESAPGTVSGVGDISKILSNFQAEVIEKFSGVFDSKKAMDSNFTRGSCLASYMHKNRGRNQGRSQGRNEAVKRNIRRSNRTWNGLGWAGLG